MMKEEVLNGDYSAFKELVREHKPIEEVVRQNVKLLPNGRGLKGTCPFHRDVEPSLNISPDKGVFHCFGCKAGGDVFSFVMLRDKVTFPESVTILAERAGLERLDLDPKQRERLQRRRR